MQIIWYIAGVAVTGVVVFFTAYFSIKFFLENDQKKRILELKFNSKSLITPVRLQAYERMAMFLERIEPNKLIQRVNNPELTSGQFKTIMLTSIRAEFEHNLSQQIYISSNVWDLIVQAKEETIQLINLCAGKLDEKAMSIDLATSILEKVADKSPGTIAMRALKEDIAILF
jgi:hypothetical protein